MSSRLEQTPPWLAPVWRLWRDAYREERLPHALLVTGAPGTGKRWLVESFVRGAQCRDSDEQGMPCERCPSCKQYTSHRRIREKSHPDIDWVTTSRYTIGVDDIRSRIIGRIALKSNYDRTKFLIIEPAEHMTKAAANALLKSLEEPPPKNSMFLISDQPGRLPPTIRSRCQRYVLPEADEEQGRAWLETVLRHGEAAEAWEASGGRPMQAWQMHEMGVVEIRRQFDQDLAAMLEGAETAAQFAARWHVRPGAEGADSKGGEDAAVPMDQRISWMAEFAVRSILKQIEASAPPGEIYAMMSSYRELLEIRKMDLDAPAPQLHMEEACLILSRMHQT